MYGIPEQLLNQFDGIQEAVEKVQADPIDERMMIAETTNMRLNALSVVFNTALAIDEGQDELLPSEILDGLMIEAFDTDSEDVDETSKAILSAHVANAFADLGVDGDVIDDLFSDDVEIADNAVEIACRTVIENMPDDGEPLDEFIKNFVYGYDDTDDDEQFDAVSVGKTTTKKMGENNTSVRYKAVKVVRRGEIMTINKRIGGGKVVLSAKQKQALAKARKKAFVPGAIKMRIKSLKKGEREGIYKTNVKGFIRGAQNQHKKVWKSITSK